MLAQGRHREESAADVELGHVDNVQVVSLAHSAYAERALAGRLFWTSSVVAGRAVPINTTTAPTVMLWNPSDSGVDAVLGTFTAAQASGSPVGGGWGLLAVSTTVSVGATIATGAPITAFAQDVLGTNVFSGRLLGKTRPMVKSSSQGTVTLGAAGTWILSLGMNVHDAATTDTAADPQYLQHDFRGEVVLMPGSAAYIASNIASVALFQTTLSWYEVPASSAYGW